MYVHRDGSIAYEGVYNRIIATKVANLLQSKYRIVHVYHPHLDTSLSSRAAAANREKAPAILVSIHHNASVAQDGRGFEVWTTRGKNQSDTLATDIYRSVFSQLSGVMRFRQDTRDGDPDFEADFQVLRQCKHPSVLVECAFFDNASDWALMQSTDWQDSMATGIAYGITKYLG